jgi:protein-S-isoprenylcysteine O-methyltransferase Ste14
MQLNPITWATIVILALGSIFAVPVLFQGFKRRGSGIKYERSFMIQRAPQLMSVFTILLIATAFLDANHLLIQPAPVWSLNSIVSAPIAQGLSWLGVLILTSGLVFMIGGWYSLGDCFSTDAELMEDHKVKSTGMLKYVMHPAYSGIIQSLFGASLASGSLLCCAFTVLMVAPLWLRRAKYEEELLLKELGESYRQYAESLKWRRIIPACIPIGM